jgi:hypothetical protein
MPYTVGDPVDGELLEISQGRIAGAEVVDGQLHPSLLSSRSRRMVAGTSPIIMLSVISRISRCGAM